MNRKSFMAKIMAGAALFALPFKKAYAAVNPVPKIKGQKHQFVITIVEDEESVSVHFRDITNREQFQQKAMKIFLAPDSLKPQELTDRENAGYRKCLFNQASYVLHQKAYPEDLPKLPVVLYSPYEPTTSMMDRKVSPFREAIEPFCAKEQTIHNL